MIDLTDKARLEAVAIWHAHQASRIRSLRERLKVPPEQNRTSNAAEHHELAAAALRALAGAEAFSYCKLTGYTTQNQLDPELAGEYAFVRVLIIALPEGGEKT
jgi:hypothetical protein